MKKIKQFAKRRWHSIPIGAMAIALLASLVITGTAFAAVTLLSGTATVTVTESITISGHTPTDGTWSGSIWTVPTYPAETKTLTLKVDNAGSIGIPLTVTIGDKTNFTESINVWDGSGWTTYGTSYTVTGTGYVQFVITASASCPTGTYDFSIGITR